ncbi:DUF1534 domain-containing protein, partial [Pseudomonas syringae pv. tomato]|nr:DUF1534 domain-containing protein [Pseudomonas syringae pv. tomato]
MAGGIHKTATRRTFKTGRRASRTASDAGRRTIVVHRGGEP